MKMETVTEILTMIIKRQKAIEQDKSSNQWSKNV